MIIKSLARKRPSFKQLIAYMNRERGDAFTRNIYDADRPASVARAFERNYAHLTKRKGANALYHEVIVLPPQPKIAATRQAEILRILAERYCELRASGNLVYGRIHQDKAHSHIHLMISANAAKSKTRTRLSRVEFAALQAQIEAEAHRAFPELDDQAIYSNPRRRDRSTENVRTEAMTRGGRKTPTKVMVRDALKRGMPKCQNEAELHQMLRGLDLELYQRGRRIGVRNLTTGARHRLSTLGIEQELRQLQTQWARDAKPKRRVLSSQQSQTRPTQTRPTQTGPVKAALDRTPAVTPTQTTTRKAVPRSRGDQDQADPPFPPPPASPPQDPRAADLLRQRKVLQDRARQTLRDFDDDLER